MSIIVENSEGWILDHLKSVSHIVNTLADKVEQSTNVKADLSISVIDHCVGPGNKNEGHIDSKTLDKQSSITLNDQENPTHERQSEESLNEIKAISTLKSDDTIYEHREEHETDVKGKAENHDVKEPLCLLENGLGLQTDTVQYRLLSNLFKILSPYKMDTQANRENKDMLLSETGEGVKEKRKRKRKRKEPLNEGEIKAEQFHNEVKIHIMRAYDSLTTLGRDTDYLPATCNPAMSDNNTAARVASQTWGPGDSLTELCALEAQSGESRVHGLTQEAWATVDPVNTVWHHHGDTSILVTMATGQYIIPQHSTWLFSDITYLHKASRDLGKFDFILMDPPWENKSVKRKKTYGYLDNYALLELPLGAMMTPGCVVGVWVTNRAKHIHFVTHTLFPKHNITYEARWFWLKITQDGRMVYDLESPHKKPYETLIFGRYNTPQDDNDHCNHSDHRQQIPDNKVIVSVPCSLHSKKPPLNDVMSCYLPTNPRCLELFARNLAPYWTSWGNEVLLHQHLDFYERVT